MVAYIRTKCGEYKASLVYFREEEGEGGVKSTPPTYLLTWHANDDVVNDLNVNQM